MRRKTNLKATAALALCLFFPVISQGATMDEVYAAREKGEEGMPVLRRAIDSDNNLVRRISAGALADIGAPAADILAEALDNSDPRVRLIAFEALAGMEKIRFEQIVKALGDEDEALRASAGEMLDVLDSWNLLPDVDNAEIPRITLQGDTRIVQDLHGISLDVSYNPRAAQGGVVENNPVFFPEGAFSLEVWMNPGPELYKNLAERASAYMVDTMGSEVAAPRPETETRHGYKMRLFRTARDGSKTRIRVDLGFGGDEEVATYMSPWMRFEPGKWYHVLFSYDGEGKGKLYLDGEKISEDRHEGRKGILAGGLPLTIGERFYARTAGFTGQIGPVRIYHRVLEPADTLF